MFAVVRGNAIVPQIIYVGEDVALVSMDVMPIGASAFRQPGGLAVFCRSGASPCFPDPLEKVSDIVQNKGQAGMPMIRLWVVQRDHTGNTDCGYPVEFLQPLLESNSRSDRVSVAE
jgi:hypothetical protein